MRKWILTVLVALIIVNAFAEKYTPDYDSLASAPIPQWWDDGKFGIFIHWGPYSVAGYKHKFRGYAEAITSDLYNNPDNYKEWMIEKFGAAPPDFGYKDMAPMFTAEKWDPAEWAALFKATGARYVIPTGEHHDGYALWDSELTPWTATKIGPKRDLIGDLAKAVRAEGLKFGISYHRERHPGRFAKNNQLVWGEAHDQIKEEIRRMPEAALLYGPFEYSDEFIADYVARWKEVERKYQPDFMWLDDVPILRFGKGDPQIIKYEDAFKQMIADYFNTAQEWGKEVWVNNKGKTANWPVGVGCLEADNLHMERAGPRWQNPATMSTSYAYMENEEINDLYKTPAELVRLLCDVVSKNGNLLLNIGPRADGVIPDGMKRRLLAMGQWMQVNGEAIYGSRPWSTYGEYRGEIIEEDNVHYTRHSQRIHQIEYRFTASKDGKTVYAIVFRPLHSNVMIEALKDSDIRAVSMLGSKARIKWERAPAGFTAALPVADLQDMPAVLKITLK
ncbi:MAG: alpha-L-fucosidase [Puniceicoccaceae bacterium]